MDYTAVNSLEPFWGVWYIDSKLGEGSYGTVYKIKREEYNETYTAALKIITVPTSEGELTRLKSEGLDDNSIKSYYRSFVKELVKEFSVMSKLKGHSNIVNYEDHMVIEHKDSMGWDILIRMELLTPLNTYLADKAGTITEKEVAKLGIDICSALELCEKHSIIHRDIKPENIFVSKFGDFKLGDFGVARTAEKATQTMSVRGTISYMAPEVYKGQRYNASVDIYSLGIVLYRLCNHNRGPFMPLPPQAITHTDRENSDTRRMKGEKFPNAANAGLDMMRIIRKATAFKYTERYRSVSQMKEDLEAVYYGRDSIKVTKGKKKGSFKRKAVTCVAGIGTVALLGAGTIFFLNRDASHNDVTETPVLAESVSENREAVEETVKVTEEKKEYKDISEYIRVEKEVLIVNKDIFGLTYDEIVNRFSDYGDIGPLGELKFDKQQDFSTVNKGIYLSSTIVCNSDMEFELIFENSDNKSFLTDVVYCTQISPRVRSSEYLPLINALYGARISATSLHWNVSDGIYYSEKTDDAAFREVVMVGYHFISY